MALAWGLRSNEGKGVVAQHVSAEGGVAIRFHGALVFALEDHALRLVVFHEEIVAVEPDGARRAVIEAIVRRADTHPGHADARDIGVILAAQGMHQAVFHEVLRRGQGLAITTRDFGGAAAQAVQVAAKDAIPPSAMDGDAAAGEAFHGTTGYQAAGAIFEQHAVGARQVEDQTLQSHVGYPGEGQHGGG